MHRTPVVGSPPVSDDEAVVDQSLRKEFLVDRTFASLQNAQEALDAWVVDYNTQRPHQALEMATPAERFRLAPVARDSTLVPTDSAEDEAGQWVLRRVASDGVISVDNRCSPAATPTREPWSTPSSTTPRDPDLEPEPRSGLRPA